MGKLQVALYWGAGCGGCDVSVLDTNEFVLELAELVDIRFWPIAVDGKYADLEMMQDEELDASFFNGAIRNEENEHVAKLLRRKSKLLVAFGSCAHLGGIPGLANQTRREDILDRVYLHNPSIQEGNQTIPNRETRINGNQLHLPVFYDHVSRLAEIVDVDYTIPGCPPNPAQVKTALVALATGQMPAKGSIVGAGTRTLCNDCGRRKEQRRAQRFYRPHEILQDPNRCLLEQGILCAGSATRSGCGVRCPNSGMPCRGCYGPAPNVLDQGAKLVTAVASIVDSKDSDEIDTILAGIEDVMGMAYRFGLPASLLKKKVH